MAAANLVLSFPGPILSLPPLFKVPFLPPQTLIVTPAEGVKPGRSEGDIVADDLSVK